MFQGLPNLEFEPMLRVAWHAKEDVLVAGMF
jgi:hypothetical protein